MPLACCSKFPTILNLLTLENVNVLNFLIEKKKVERVIIMDNESAWKLLRSIETSPRNLLYALTFNNKGSGITQWYPVPNYRSYQVKQNPNDFCKLQRSGSKYLGIMPAKPSTKTPPAAPLPKNQLPSDTVPYSPPPNAPLPKIQLPCEPVNSSTPPPTTPKPLHTTSGLKYLGIMPAKQLKSESGAIKTEIPAGNSSLGNCKSKLIPVKKQRNNLRATKLSYGEKIIKLVSEIKKNQNRFKKLPIGPLDMEVKVKENISKEFVEGIETELGKLLLSFLVDNIDDKGVVIRLAKDVDVDITVIVSKYSERLV